MVHNGLPKITNKLYTPTPRQFKHHNVSLSPSQFVLILSLLPRFSFPEQCSTSLPTKQVNMDTNSKNQKMHPSQSIHADFLHLCNITFFFEQGNFVRHTSNLRIIYKSIVTSVKPVNVVEAKTVPWNLIYFIGTTNLYLTEVNRLYC